jgi:hypothetical protein
MNTRTHVHGSTTGVAQPTIAYRHLLAAIADRLPADHVPWVELATVAALQRSMPWSGDGRMTSLLVTHDAGIAARAASMINECQLTARIALSPPVRRSNHRPRLDVLVVNAESGQAERWLRGLWEEAVRALRDGGPGNRTATARAIVRSALLTSSSNVRRRQIRINTPDSGTLRALVDAGAALGVAMHSHWRRGRWLATVDSSAAATRLFRAVGAGPIAQRWTLDNGREPPDTDAEAPRTHGRAATAASERAGTPAAAGPGA